MVVVLPATATTRILFLHAGCFFLILLSFNVAAAASSPPSFSFDFSNTSSYNKSDLGFLGDAGLNGNRVDLTCDVQKTQDDVNCKGRMWYNHPVLFYDNGTGEVASFATTFNFIIQPINGTPRGDGMAFFLAGYPLELPRSTSGNLLGLTDNGNQNVRTISDSSKFVAVEFDTYGNAWEPAGFTDHIGIDLSSLTSVNATKLPTGSLTGTMTASITFNGTTRMLEASLHFDSNTTLGTAHVKTQLPEPLSDLLPSEVAVGFSAATGIYIELNQILSWSFNSTMASKETPAGSSSAQQVLGTKGTKSLAIILPTAVVAALASISLCIWCVRRKRSGRLPLRPDHHTANDLETAKSNLLSLSSIQAATNNFDESMKLGEGGFGEVYKGVLISGQEVAVKRLSKGSKQGIEEVKNELVLAAKLHHKNLVQLVGFCLEGDERLLIYEYMSNKSLDTILFDPEEKGRLDWGKRFNVIEGVARGLQYLHEDSQEKIIHRDLKASNVLLDADMNPKIGDFGLARLFVQDQTRDITSHIAGTFGYMSPEYVMCGHFSTKLDVFSFGILVVEIVTGLRNNGSYFADQNEDVISTMWRHWEEGMATEMIDNSLGRNYSRAQVLRCLHVGLLCLQQNPLDRPTMWEIMLMLDNNNGATMSLPAPMRPTFFIDGSSGYSRHNGNVARSYLK